jgi:sulfonate transport system permease protein
MTLTTGSAPAAVVPDPARAVVQDGTFVVAAPSEALDLRPPTAVLPAGRPRLVSLGLRVLLPAALLLLWWWATRPDGWVRPQVLAAPGLVWTTFVDLAGSGVLWDNLSASLQRAGTGLLIGGTIGLALGVLTGFARLGEELLDPTLQMLRTIPFLALGPLFIVWFGIGETPKVVLIAVATAFPLYLNTYAGVRSVDRRSLEAARVFGLSRLALVRRVVVPAALPGLLVGLRVALGVSLLGLIFAEQINTTQGIGYLMTSAMAFFQTDVMVVCILVYALWGLLADLLVRLLEHLLMPWRRTHARTRAGAR